MITGSSRKSTLSSYPKTGGMKGTACAKVLVLMMMISLELASFFDQAQIGVAAAHNNNEKSEARGSDVTKRRGQENTNKNRSSQEKKESRQKRKKKEDRQNKEAIRKQKQKEIKERERQKRLKAMEVRERIKRQILLQQTLQPVKMIRVETGGSSRVMNSVSDPTGTKWCQGRPTYWLVGEYRCSNLETLACT